MFEFFDKFVTERHHLVVDEETVTKVLKEINARNKKDPDIKVDNCGWADDPNKWFIHFTTTKAKWRQFVVEQKVVRVWGHDDIPKNTVGTVYSID